MSMDKLCYSVADIMDLVDYEEKYSDPLRYINFVLSFSTCVVGVIGNAIIIFFNIFVMKKHKSRIWFLNLAITDFVSLLILPLHAYAVLKGSWPYGKVFCKVFLFVITVNMYGSMFILIALNLSRVLSVTKPMFHREFISQRFSRWTCTIIWVITIFATIPVLLHSGEFTIGDDTYCSLYCAKEFHEKTFNPTYNITEQLNLESKANLDVYKFKYLFTECSPEECCSDDGALDVWNEMKLSIQSFAIPFIVIGYFLPFCVIIVSNISIAVQVRNSQTVNTHRLYKIVITIIIVYFVTWTPLILGEMIILASVSTMNFVSLFKMLTFMPLLCTIAYSSCSVNPIMYVLVGRQARASLANYLTSMSIRSN